MGNILTLARYQGGTRIDSLLYHYPNGGLSNQPDTIRDLSGSSLGAPAAAMAYTYSGNGYIKKDGRNGNNISYNYLNLPQTVTGNANITYTYDADGRKLRKVSVQGAVTTRADYIDGIQYRATGTDVPEIELIQTQEGRARPVSTTAYGYEYDLADHLGNARLTLATSTGAAVKVQSNDYYPFGMVSAGGFVSGTENRYLYNGKELQEESRQYDYGARFYDPVIARWTSVDPLAEINRRWSPYNYGMNNPIIMTDPDGMAADSTKKSAPSQPKPIELKEVVIKSYKKGLAAVSTFFIQHSNAVPKSLLVADAIVQEIPVVNVVFDVITAGFILHDLTKDSHVKMARKGKGRVYKKGQNINLSRLKIKLGKNRLILTQASI